MPKRSPLGPDRSEKPDRFSMMQDVIPPADRSIRNIPVPPGRRRPPEPPRPAERYVRSEPEDIDPQEFSVPQESRRGPRIIMWTGAILSIAALLFFGFSILFAGATVSVTPKSEDVTIDGSFSASPDAPVTGLTYQLVTLERTLGEVVEATGEADVERRASGTIVISNNYSTSVQRLIKNTRFEAPDGKIYRINESIDVPGQKTVNGALVPGESEVVVYADSPGEGYNRGLTDFTIPGFKGDPRYTKFTARSKTPMSGGFIGRERVVSEGELAAARGRLHEQLKRELEVAARAQMPAGFVLFDDATFVSFSSEGTAPEGEGEVKVTEKGVLTGVLFNNRELAAFIARNSIGSYNEEPVYLPNTSRLTFAISGKDTIALPLERPLAFTLAGNALVVWLIDEVELKNAIVGRQKAALPTIMAEFPANSFSVSSRPFWSSELPDDMDRLTVSIEVPQEME